MDTDFSYGFNLPSTNLSNIITFYPLLL